MGRFVRLLWYLALWCAIHIAEKLLHPVVRFFEPRAQRNDESDLENKAESDPENYSGMDVTGRLPYELLAIIFVYYVEDYHFGNSGIRTRTPPDWVNVSYVCRRWRAVALRCVDLWAHHFWVSRRWSEALLARSRQALLKVHIEIDAGRTPNPKPMWKDMANLLHRHAGRIQELQMCIYLSREPDADSITSMLSFRTPRLEHLYIRTPSGRLAAWTSSVHWEGDTASLRTPEVSRWPFPWYSLRLDVLTVLHLWHLRPEDLQTIENLLAALSHMHELQEIYLNDAIADATEFLRVRPTINTFRKIDLPHLSCLGMTETLASAAIALLLCVRIPADTKVRIESYVEAATGFLEDHYALLSTAIAQRYNILEDRRVSSLVMQFRRDSVALMLNPCGRDCEHFSGFKPSLVTDYLAHAAHPSSLEIVIGRRRPHIWLREGEEETVVEVDWNRVVVALCCGAPLTNVQSVHVIHPPGPPIFWRTVLEHIPALQYIKLSKGDMPDIFTPSAREDENSPGNQDLLAPEIQEVELYHINFAHSVRWGRPITLDRLLGTLSTRNTAGQANCRVRLNRCRRGKLELENAQYP